MLDVAVFAALEDKFTAEELVEKLNLNVTEVIANFLDQIEEEFSENGLLEDEWREFYGEN